MAEAIATIKIARYCTHHLLGSPFLVQSEGEGWRWQDTLPLERVNFSSDRDSGWWGDFATQSCCSGDTSTAGNSWGCGNEPGT